MKRQYPLFIIQTLILVIGILSCNDIIKEAVQDGEDTADPAHGQYYPYEVADFTATQDFNSTDMTLAWVNPEDSEFERVIILRKEGSYPSSILDTSAVIVYSGTESPHVDLSLAPNFIYYYMAFTQDTSDRYSKGVGVFNEIIPVIPGDPDTYGYEAIDFTATQDPGTTNVSLTWINPSDPDFDTIVILRKTETFPTGYDDATATIIYSGSTSPFQDMYLTVETTYCYAIYAKSVDSLYSSGRMQAKKIESPAAEIYLYDVSDFTASEGSNNREILLTWVNPSDTSFDSVRLLRKTTGYPTGPEDGSATVLYLGTNQRYTDPNKAPSTTYYYAIYTINMEGQYSRGVLARWTVTETSLDIRQRSFFIIGGSGNYPASPQTSIITSVDIFDPLTDTITTGVTTLPTGRYFCDIASVDGNIYVFGGFDSAAAPVTTVDILDVETLTWSSGTPLPAVRAALRVAEWNNKIYTMFGTATANAAGGVIDGWRYDPLYGAGGTWLPDANNIYKDLTTARVNPCAEVYNGIIYYWGGIGTGGTVVNTGYYYNIYSNTEVAITANGGMTNFGCTSVMYHETLDSGEDSTVLFILGGGTGAGNTGIPHPTLTFANNVIYMLQLPSWGGVPNWIQLTGESQAMNVNRAYAGAESFGDYIYIFGGVIQTNAITSIEKLNVNNGNPNQPWTTLSETLGTARYGFGITKVNN